MPAGTLLLLAFLAPQDPRWLREEECRHPGGAVRAALASATRALATVGRDGEVRIWKPTTDAAARSWRMNIPSAIEFSPDGRTLVTAEASGRITFWDPDSGKSLATIEAGLELAELRFAPDGSAFFAAAADGAPRGWDARTRAALPAFAAGPRPLRGLAVSSDRIASGDDRGGVRLWSRSGGAIRAESSIPSPAVSMAFSPDGRTLAAAVGGGLYWWTGDLEGRRFVPETGIRTMAFTPDGSHLYVGLGGGRVSILDPAGGDWAGGNPGLDAPILAIALGRDILFLAGADGSAAEFRTDTGSGVLSRRGPRSAVRSLSASAGGTRLASGDSIGRVSVWDVDAKKLRFELPETGAYALGVALSPRGDRLLAPLARGTVSVRDAATGEERSSWSVKADATVALGFVEGEPLGVFRASGTRVVGNARIGWSIPYPAEGPGEPSFGRLGDRDVVALPGHEASLRHPVDGTILFPLGDAQAIALSPDGRFAATFAGGASPVLWDLGRRRSLGPVGPPLPWLVGQAFSPDGFTLATLHGDGALRFLDLLTGMPSSTLELPHGRIEAFAFLAPGRVAVGSTRGGIAILDAPSGEAEGDPGAAAAREIEEAIRALDADDAEKRRAAEARLRALGDEAESALRTAHGQARSEEAKETLARLLARLDHPLLASGTMLGRLRLVQALERNGNAEARERLEVLSRASPSPRQRAAATAALRRLADR